ncbi:hypothetical protein BC332_09404 [Capsicum chinense]|nr:hypothetical protein BC332_09404 [Capsicum chinense]
MDICKVLINYALKLDPEFCNEILGCILLTCSRNVYEIIVDFDWYVSLLGEMTRIPHCQKGEEIENQLVDIGMRVKDARPQLVRVGRDLLIDPALLGNPFVHRILSAAAWVLGEYVRFSKIPSELVREFEDMSVAHEWLSSTSSKVEPITEESIVSILNFVETTLGPLSGSHEVEILERSRNVLGLVELIREELLGYLVKREEDNDEGKRRTHEMIKLIAEAFSEELGPVSASSQERVPMPEGMVLNQNLDDLDAKSGDLGLHIPTSFSLGRSISSEKSQKKEMVYDDYPPANDLKTGNNADDEADDLVKLTEQSLFPKKKANQAKPRPVVVSVVKLDDGDGPFIPAKKVESNDDLISGAV